jgi:hypothetical protein
MWLCSKKDYFALYDELDRLQPDLFDLLAERDGYFTRDARSKVGNAT